MIVSVDKRKVKTESRYIINRGEYKATPIDFVFSEDYEGLVKKALFVKSGANPIEVSIINNKCDIPYEVLNEEEFELRVYGYEVQDEELVLRYSPTYTKVFTRAGSYIEGGVEPTPITPSEYEQYMQAMNDAIEDIEQIDIDAEKEGHTATITVTTKAGQTKTVTILDGEKGDKGDKGDKGNTGATGPQGAKGDKGDKGATGSAGANAKINGVNTLTIEAGSNISLSQSGSTMTISASGGSGGTSDHSDLTNKPSINSITLSGNKTLSDLGIQSAGSYEETANKKTSITSNSTDTDYPSAKAVWTLFNSITDGDEVSY